MFYSSYEEYLNSAEWKQKAKGRARIDNYRCTMCGCEGTMNNPLQCHHITYRNIYNENTYKDLLTLCRNCHESVHKMMNRLTAPDKHGWKDELRVENHVLEVGGMKEGINI